MTPDVNCAMAELPYALKAFTVSNSDNTFTIILNSRHTHEQHLRSYHHEMQHIENGDYDKKCDVDVLEFWTHKEFN